MRMHARKPHAFLSLSLCLFLSLRRDRVEEPEYLLALSTQSPTCERVNTLALLPPCTQNKLVECKINNNNNNNKISTKDDNKDSTRECLASYARSTISDKRSSQIILIIRNSRIISRSRLYRLFCLVLSLFCLFVFNVNVCVIL